MGDLQSMPATRKGQEVEYRDIKEWPGYLVGSDGSVWSCLEVYHTIGTRGFVSKLSASWRRLAPLQAKGGYVAVSFRKDGRAYRRLVHTIVLTAFVGPCPVGMECCHGDRDRANNRLSNLRWGTPAENAADRDRHGTTARGSRNGNAKLTDDQVFELREINSKGGNVRSVAERFGVHPETAYRIATGQAWGMYATEDDMANQGKRQRGERNHQAKLTDAQAEEVRHLRASGLKLRVIAERFSVQMSTVSRIASGVRRRTTS